MFQAPSFKATPAGILLDNIPLRKISQASIPDHTWRYIKRAEELFKEVSPEEWDSQQPFDGTNFPILAKVNMLLALSMGKANNSPVQSPFNFIHQIARGKTLLVGEGNFSFAVSLIQSKQIVPTNIVATTLTARKDWPESTQQNVASLEQSGVKVLDCINATNLSNTLGTEIFDNIIFQFPHTGSRTSVKGRTANFMLVRNFLRSASSHLRKDGMVFISIVDNPHYRGTFQLEEAAHDAGFLPPQEYPFDPSEFEEYEHITTHEDAGALRHHKNFSTWVFRKKPS